MQQKIRRVGDKSKRTFMVPRHTADALVRHGTFEYAEGPIPRTKPQTASRVARQRDEAVIVNKTTGKSVEEEAPLEDKTKAELAELLRAAGEKVDMRLSKDDLLKQAKRYQRRDMRAE